MELNTQKTEQKVSEKMNNKFNFFGFFQYSKFHIRHSSPRGFTLIETLVAIAVLLVAVVGPISLIGDALHKLYYAKDEMIAINLAQEGVEAARRMRDSNMLAGVAWDTGLASPNYRVDVGRIRTGLNPLAAYASAVPQPVYFHSATGLYRQIFVATPTQFKRILTITSINANERKVTVLVTWLTGGQAGSIQVSENIFKWLP